MQFNYQEISSLPRLAWCAQVPSDREIITIIHGSGVEIKDNWFTEGAWDGPFDSPDIDEFCGTGGRIVDDGVVFMSPTNPYRGLVSCKTSKGFIISNSLPFLLARIGDQPTLRVDNYYQKLFIAFNSGYSEEPKVITMRKGSEVRLHFYCDITVTKNNISKTKKSAPDEPTSFEDYRDRIIRMLERLRENAMDPRRKTVYEPVVTLSRGYDSAVCGALAKKAGWENAVTLVSKDEDEDNTDDGTPVAEALGMNIEKFDGDAWSEIEGIPEAQFVATAWGGAMARFAGTRQRLQNTLLVFGCCGDRIWNANSLGVNKLWLRKRSNETFSMGAESLWEFQLRTGFIAVYPATYLGIYWRLIHKFMTDEELQKWSVGGDYDRPFARRLAEELGVPRQLFGQQKMAKGHVYPANNPSPTGDKDFKKFLDDHGIKLTYPPPEVKILVLQHFHWGIHHCMKDYQLAEMELFN